MDRHDRSRCSAFLGGLGSGLLHVRDSAFRRGGGCISCVRIMVCMTGRIDRIPP